jgi:predicted nucleic acid-binding protein
MGKKLVLIDTNFLILALGDNLDYGNVLKKIIKQDRLALSVIVVAEFLTGADDQEEMMLFSLLRRFGVVNVDLEVASMAAFYRKKFLKLNKKIYLPDCLIAASCKVNKMQILTLNKRDYPMKDIDFVNLDDFRN